MAKNWELSRQIQLDNTDTLAPGALAYFFAAGTTTPYTVYADAVLTTPRTHPVVADAFGRWPRVFIPYTATGYRERVLTAGGTLLWDDDGLSNTDPYNPAISVDPNALIQTGDFIFSLVNTTRSGFVRANGRTIGNASSGASERANADTSALFAFFWNNLTDANAPVSTGRGATAAADYAANKTITLPDARGSGLLGLDDMGNTAASRLTAATFTSGSATAAGSICGENAHVLITAELASHSHTLTAASAASNGAHTHTGTTDAGGGHTPTGTVSAPVITSSLRSVASSPANQIVATNTANNVSGPDTTVSTASAPTFTGDAVAAHTHTFTTASSGAHTHTLSGSTDSTGSGTAHNTVSRSILGTFFVKL